MISISAFKWVPDFAQGQVRDLRPRWALEEAELPYTTRLLALGDQDKPEYRALQPFGQVPILEEDGRVLFETGAIVLHIAERHDGLLPKHVHARSRAIAWMFAALNTMEPPIVELGIATMLERNESWYEERLPILRDRVSIRLDELSDHLGGADWLDGAFSAGDLLMVTVLRRLNASRILDDYPTLASYVARGEARPAFRRAFDAQLAVFTAASR
jgi:glutathione S-transferase